MTTKMAYYSKKYDRKGDNVSGKTYCSHTCKGKGLRKGKDSACDQCGVPIYINTEGLREYKNHFCSHSCGTRYKNIHGVVKIRSRSKLEKWVETKLLEKYHTLDILFNNRTKIKAELDIYIPALNLAFELNRPYHYKPIWGDEALYKTQERDKLKCQRCIDSKIELHTLNTSDQGYFKESTCAQYLDVISKIIDDHLTHNSLTDTPLISRV